MRRFTLFIFFLLASFISFAQAPTPTTLRAIDRYIDTLMRDWNIPGLALGIVYNDQLVYSKGYGYRNLEQKLPVTTTTLFPIASNTKLFTATAAVLLEEEGKLSLDKPARTYMPSLTFSSDELNAKVTLRDMLSHRTGLPSYDVLWVGSDRNRKDIVAQVVYMKPQLGFREGYIYNNMMYTTAGAVMESVTGKTWEDIVREKLLVPLGMNATVFSTSDIKKGDNYALAYFEKDSTRTLLPKRFEAQTPALGPAGTMRSTVEDMSHWMIAQLNEGRYAGKQAVSAKAIQATLQPNILADKVGLYDELSSAVYALGRNILSYKGYKVATHTGSIDGYYSNLTFVPGTKLGVFMVHNGQAGGAFRTAMAYPVLDLLLGLAPTPWSKRFLTEYNTGRVRERRALDSLLAMQVKGTSPSHPLQAYAGTYTNPMLEPIKVELVNNTLVLSFKKVTAPLAHFHYDQFHNRQEGTDYPWFRFKFLTSDKGDIDRITIVLPGTGEEVFTRKK
jgi:CubicO group peptidase (beta-lactamase class C family)